MKKLFEIRKLSPAFCEAFPSDSYPEMEHKANRPYVVLLVEMNGFRFAIPLRTNIRHAYCYKFRTSDRATESTTGIDYSKAVIITDDALLGETTDINGKEYLELRKKVFFILKQFQKYVDGYIAVKNGNANDYVAKRYRFSTLRYFDDLLLRR